MKLVRDKSTRHLSGDQLFTLARIWKYIEGSKPHLAQWLKDGLSEAQVAERMHWSVLSLRHYMKPLKEKLKEAGINAALLGGR